MKFKKFFALFTAFIMFGAIFLVGCDISDNKSEDEGGGILFGPGKTDDDSDDDSICTVRINARTLARKDQAIIFTFEEIPVPGSEGECQFVIRSERSETCNFSFSFEETYERELEKVEPLMTYRVKCDGAYLSEEWQSVGFEYENIQILPNGEHQMTLQWRYPFEAANEDIYEKIEGKKLFIVIYIWAEVVEK